VAGAPQVTAGEGDGEGSGLGELDGDGDGEGEGDGDDEGDGLGLGLGLGLGVGDGSGVGEVEGRGLGDGEVPATTTSTLALAEDDPARALSLYVVVRLGATTLEPLDETAPTLGSISTESAPATSQFRRTIDPGSTGFGVALKRWMTRPDVGFVSESVSFPQPASANARISRAPRRARSGVSSKDTIY